MLIYRIILLVISPFVAIKLLVSLVRGVETRAGLAERLGKGAPIDSNAPLIWVHGASLGELTAAKPLIEQLLENNPGLNVLATMNTYTARSMVMKWQHPRIFARLAPLDAVRITNRFLSAYRPVIALTLENELWPNRTLCSTRLNIPVLIVAGRMSARTAGIWARFGGLTRQVMGAITSLTPLDTTNAKRFERLGLGSARITGPLNLKATVVLSPPDPDELVRLSSIFPRKSTILAASTHPDEELLILQAFRILHQSNPSLRLILAPRHPKRSDEVTAMIENAGLAFSRRSDGREPKIKDAVYLADTLGEMPLWYSLSAITIVGGSFVEKGGHTPFEPVQFRSLVVHGPDVSNHQQAYTALAKNNAAFEAGSADELSKVLNYLISMPDPSKTADLAAGALTQLRPDMAQTDRLIAQINQLIADNTAN